MIKQIDNELIEIKSKLKEIDTYQHKLKDVLTELKSYQDKKKTISEQLEKEKKDVERLEKLSFISIWYSLIGGKTEKLKREKEDVTKVEYEYKFIIETIKRLEEESKYYKDKIYNLNQLKDRYNELIKEKEKVILDGNNDLYQSLFDINQKIIDNEGNIKEIHEAIVAGTKVINALNTITKSLSKARGWGTYDLLGGGIFSSMAKHSHIKDAENQIKDLKYLLNKYSRELKDVNMNISIELDIGDTLKFADLFLDGLFADSLVQSRLNRANSQIKNALKKIKQQINNLNKQFKINKEEIDRLNKQKRDLLSPK